MALWSMVVALLLVVAGVPGVHALAQDEKPPRHEVLWTPELAPSGPLVVVISLPAQQAHVYRNGVRIGMSPVSSGKPGHETPAGIFRVLEKRREHYSNLYDNAPMPFMQRLTWDGVALHAGRLPGYPASHGCVRLPPAFAEKLYAVTGRGTPVVIASEETFPSTVTWPGLLAPVDAGTGMAILPGAPPDATWAWHPERSPYGPLTILLSTADRRVVVLRNAVEIGSAEIGFHAAPGRGLRAYVLLEGSLPQPSHVLPDRRALRWRALRLAASGASTEDPPVTMEISGLSVPEEFARAVYDTLQPGDRVIVTDEHLRPAAGSAVLEHGAGRSSRGEAGASPAPATRARGSCG